MQGASPNTTGTPMVVQNPVKFVESKEDPTFPDELPDREPANEKFLQLDFKVLFGDVQKKGARTNERMGMGMGRMDFMMGGAGFMFEPIINENSWCEEKVVIEFFGEELPQTVENFRSIGAEEHGLTFNGK